MPERLIAHEISWVFRTALRSSTAGADTLTAKDSEEEDRLAERGLIHPSRATRRPIYPIWEIERFLRDTSQTIEV